MSWVEDNGYDAYSFCDQCDEVEHNCECHEESEKESYVKGYTDGIKKGFEMAMDVLEKRYRITNEVKNEFI